VLRNQKRNQRLLQLPRSQKLLPLLLHQKLPQKLPQIQIFRLILVAQLPKSTQVEHQQTKKSLLFKKVTLK